MGFLIVLLSMLFVLSVYLLIRIWRAGGHTDDSDDHFTMPPFA